MNEDFQRFLSNYILTNIDFFSKIHYDYADIWRGYIDYPL